MFGLPSTRLALTHLTSFVFAVSLVDMAYTLVYSYRAAGAVLVTAFLCCQEYHF